MKTQKKHLKYKVATLLISVFFAVPMAAAPSTFDGDKPVASYNNDYSQSFNTSAGWDGTKFYQQWSTIDPSVFKAEDIANGYLGFKWKSKRIIYSNITYQTPYIFEANLDLKGKNRAGMIIRYIETGPLDNQLQENKEALGYFNRAGIAFYPKDADNFYVQFSGTEAGAATAQTRIIAPRPSGVTNFMNGKNTLRIEDFGATIYVYINENPFVRIDLSGLTATTYSSGTVYDANLVSLGTFSNMVVPTTGIVSIAQRDVSLALYQVHIQSIQSQSANTFDSDKPSAEYTTAYNQVFSTWDATKFSPQWDMLNSFDANNIISDSYLKFAWEGSRVLRSKSTYKTPYIFKSIIDNGGNPWGGMIVRAPGDGPIDDLQLPVTNVGVAFNRAGIALYPTQAGTALNVQFVGAVNGYSTPVYKCVVAIPDGMQNLNTGGSGEMRIEDFGSTIYVYYKGQALVRINLSGLTGDLYTSGTVYNAYYAKVGEFSEMHIPVRGKIGIAARLNNDYKVYASTVLITEIAVPPIASTSFDDDKPIKTYNTEYKQTFNTTAGWNNAQFYNQWTTLTSNCFSASDIDNGYLAFSWSPKRAICANRAHTQYAMEAKIDYAGGSNRGGIVLRFPNVPPNDRLQEPGSGFLNGFNNTGIAIYPADANNVNVQFSAANTGNSTAQTIIQVGKPAGVSNLLSDANTYRVEDFGTSIYVYINDYPFFRINLGSKNGEIYTAGTVYNAAMEVAGTFVGMEVEATGKIAIAQRDAALKLYEVSVKSNDLQSQIIDFSLITKKLITDAPFTISAVATSGLPVTTTLISGPATLSGNTITLNGASGIVSISAVQGGNSMYYAAPEVIRTFYVSDPALANVLPNTQDYVDNWVATDALNRELPNYTDAGGKRENKKVGVFYYIWNGYHGTKVFDITKIIANQPINPLSASNTAWGGVSAFHFWGEPEVGYYRSEDPWVIRRDLQMLSNAHVDFVYFDVTNAYTYLETVKAFCNVSVQMRKEGIYTPEIVFCTKAKSGKVMNTLYDEFYSQSLFDDLWFRWDGKPLILGDKSDAELRTEVKDFFTIKFSWAWTDAKNTKDHWQWLDSYPQDYGWSVNKQTPDQIPVSLAQHPTSSIGSSYSNAVQPPVNEKYVTEFTGKGIQFAEQWKKALAVDPTVIMITQWNEFTAQRAIWSNGLGTFAGRPITDGESFFVDAFSEEFNRDIAPMKGGHTDNYYYQMVANIRKFKGMNAPQAFSASKTINVDGSFAEWNTVTPLFKDPIGDVMHRNFKGYDITTTLTNNTGRNDIIESRATFDANNVYFYVKTAQTITAHTDPNWMLLFIDVDRNKGTGWEGYDYVVNLGVNSETQTTIKQWDGTTWSNASSINYAKNAMEMEISVPRNAMNITTETPQFYFHWADNPQHLNDISTFFTDGESAPDRRFNYNFSSTEKIVVPETAYKNHVIPGTIEFEDFNNGGSGIAYSDATLGNSGGAYRTDESVDIESIGTDAHAITSINNDEWLQYTANIQSIGTYTLNLKYAATTADNKIKIYVDNVAVTEVVDLAITDAATTVWGTKSIDLQLKVGTHRVKVMIEKANASFKLDKMEFVAKSVVNAGTGTGLSKSIYSASAGGRVWFQTLACSGTIDPEINHTWINEGPGCNVAQDFWNIRWEGQIEPLYTETHTFYLTIKDMGKVWINNQLIIDAWTSANTGTTVTGTIDLVAGQKVPIKVDFAHKIGEAAIKLEWSSNSISNEIVPFYQLYPIDPNAVSKTQLLNFGIYPNPAKQQISINSEQNSVHSIKITDLQGREVYVHNKSFHGIETIDLNLAKGIYLVKLSGTVPFEVQKLIVE